MSTPLLILNHESPLPPYEQIRVRLRVLIASGQLHPGALLPSVRQLARDLNVAPNTIVRAYNELEREGWVTTSARRGVIVAEHLPQISAQERAERLTQAVDELLLTAHELGASIEEIVAEIQRQAQH
jgi:GntR family transcriptional regulator